MIKYFLIVSIFLTSFLSAQNIFLNKVVKVHDNKDKFLYRIQESFTSKEYLGELEVQGFSNKDQEVFDVVYKKAKQIGANAYSLKSVETIDGNQAVFNPSQYILNLYYIESPKDILDTGFIYIVSSSDKNLKIEANDKVILMTPRSFVKIPTQINKPNSISTRKLFGSSIKFDMNTSDLSKYFLLLGFQIKGDGSLNIKSGDIVGLEESYGQFLTMLYSEVK